MICNPSFKVLLVIFNAHGELEQCLFELWPSSAVLQQQQPVELGKRRTGLSLFPWPLGAESFSGSSREAELPREDVPLWNVSAPKGLCCLQGGVRSLSAFFGSNTVLLGFSCPHFNNGRYTQLTSWRTCQFSPFSYAGKKRISRLVGMKKLRVIF